jgi:inosose dehydratase
MEGEAIRYPRMLDELIQTGYVGTELGDWGFMPSDPGLLAATLLTRKLAITGAFVPVALANAESHDAGVENAVRTATLLAQTAQRTGQPHAPWLVLADENGTVAERTQNAGRITPAMELDAAHWKTFGAGADRIAQAVLDETGLRTVFHHHCAGYVETPAEIDRFLDVTDPDLVGLVFDTGHFAYGAGGCNHMIDALLRYDGRIWYVHFKDCSEEVAREARTSGWDYFTAVQKGIFCELGRGCVDFPVVLAWLNERRYRGFVTVEQDVLPGMGTPAESASNNRAYLRTIGL